MTSIASDPNNPQIVYAGTRDAGIFRTSDGGASWSPSRNGLTFYPIRSLAINPDNSGILYAGTDYDGVWKSTDSGATWFKSSNGLDEGMIIFNIIVDPKNPNTLYAGLAGGVAIVCGGGVTGGAAWGTSSGKHGDLGVELWDMEVAGRGHSARRVHESDPGVCGLAVGNDAGGDRYGDRDNTDQGGAEMVQKAFGEDRPQQTHHGLPSR